MSESGSTSRSLRLLEEAADRISRQMTHNGDTSMDPLLSDIYEHIRELTRSETAPQEQLRNSAAIALRHLDYLKMQIPLGNDPVGDDNHARYDFIRLTLEGAAK
jgi:hypothetical protein